MTAEDRAAELFSAWYKPLSLWIDSKSRAALMNAIAAAIREAVAEEREACAKVAEEFHYEDDSMHCYYPPRIALAIRARGERK